MQQEGVRLMHAQNYANMMQSAIRGRTAAEATRPRRRPRRMALAAVELRKVADCRERAYRNTERYSKRTPQ